MTPVSLFNQSLRSLTEGNMRRSVLELSPFFTPQHSATLDKVATATDVPDAGIIPTTTCLIGNSSTPLVQHEHRYNTT